MYIQVNLQWYLLLMLFYMLWYVTAMWHLVTYQFSYFFDVSELFFPHGDNVL